MIGRGFFFFFFSSLTGVARATTSNRHLVANRLIGRLFFGCLMIAIMMPRPPVFSVFHVCQKSNFLFPLFVSAVEVQSLN